MAARCNWSQPIYFARLHKFFRHFWQNLSKGSFGQLTTFPEDLFSPCMESSHTSAPRQRDKHCGSWHSHISCYRTCDSWTAISHCLHFPQSAAGRRRNVRIIKDRKSFFQCEAHSGTPTFFLFSFFLSPSCAASSVEKSFYCHGRWHFSRAVIAQSPAFILPGGSRALPLVFKRKSLQH